MSNASASPKDPLGEAFILFGSSLDSAYRDHRYAKILRGISSLFLSFCRDLGGGGRQRNVDGASSRAVFTQAVGDR